MKKLCVIIVLLISFHKIVEGMEKENNLQIKKIVIGASSRQGDRPTQEDRIKISEDEETGISFFGLFDGHAGTQTVDYVYENLNTKIFAQNCLQENLKEAIINGFEEINKATENNFSGSTATVIVRNENQLYIANIGDSPAYVEEDIFYDNNNENHPLSLQKKVTTLRKLITIHNSGNKEEFQRLTKLNCKIFQQKDTYLRCMSYTSQNPIIKTLTTVCHMAQDQGKDSGYTITRSFGDSPAQFMSAQPSITEYVLSPLNRFFIIASDGLTDIMTPEAIQQYIDASLKKRNLTHTTINVDAANEIAQGLVNFALSINTTEINDNTSVIIAFIKYDD